METFGRHVFIQFRVFPTSTNVDITIYQNGTNVLYFYYNIAMSKARRIRNSSVFTSGGKFPVLTLSYINTALRQSAFRIYKCYSIIHCEFDLRIGSKFKFQAESILVLIVYLGMRFHPNLINFMIPFVKIQQWLELHNVSVHN
jgi:hypothetical protein